MNQPSFIPSNSRNWHLALLVGLSLLTLSSMYFAYAYSSTSQKLSQTQLELIDTENSLASSTQTLFETQTDLQSLHDQLAEVQNQNNSYKKQLKKANNKVEDLTKYKETDKELLRKYSKVFFLSDNYVPLKLSDIEPQYTWEKSRSYQIHSGVLPHLTQMIDAAANDGVNLLVISAYRSFGTQASLKASYKVTYGAGTANQFSADQGYSEHQLGTAVDLTTPQTGANFEAFDKTTAYAWLKEHAQDYGFTLSYPQGNKYYQYEPWHWRFVGKDLARDLKDDNKYFYDLDQREIDEYLVDFFD